MPSYNYGNINPYMNQGMQVPNYTQPNNYSYMQGQPNNYGYQQPAGSYNGYPQDNQSGKPVWVHSEQEARMYPVAKGDTIWMMDSDNMVAYFKSVDNVGMSMPLRVYDMVERQTANIVPAQYSQISMDNNTNDTNNMQGYVTWEAYHELENKLNDLINSNKHNQPQTPTSPSGKKGNNNA